MLNSSFQLNLNARPTPLDLAAAAERRERASIAREVEAGATSAAERREFIAGLTNRPTEEDATAEAEERAAAAETRAARREIALEYKLSQDDAELLDACASDDAARRIAARLASISTDRPTARQSATRPTYRR